MRGEVALPMNGTGDKAMNGFIICEYSGLVAKSPNII